MRRSNHEARRKSKQREVVALLVLGLSVNSPIFSQHCFTAGQVLIFLGAVGESSTVVFLCLQLNPEQALLPGIARSSMAGPGPPTSLASGTVSCSYKGRIEGVVSKQLLQEDCYCG